MRLFFLLWMCIVAAPVFSQTDTLVHEHQKARNRDRVLVDLSFTGWTHEISNLKTKWYSRGLGISYLHNFPISKHVDFAMGLGVKNANYYHRSELTERSHPDSNAIGQSFSYFDPISDTTAQIKRNKLSLSHFTFPVELRFKGKPNKKNRVFKLAFGLQADFNFEAHAKQVNGDLKFKDFNFNNFEKWSFGTRARIGYHRTALHFEMNFNSIFKPNNGPSILPFRAGFTYTLLD